MLGHTARRQMRRTGERGDGMALTGLVFGWIVALLAVILAGLLIVVSVATHTGHSVVVKPVTDVGIPGAPGQGG